MVYSPDMRESCGGDRNKILLCNPSIPMLHKHIQCVLVVLHLAKREFVNDRVVVRINKNAWRYPRLASAHSSQCPRSREVTVSAEHAYLENEPPSTGGSKGQMAFKHMGSA
jgi:hypothetical protein